MPQKRSIEGIAVSPGLALGKVHVVSSDRGAAPIWHVPAEDVPGEFGRIADAVRSASDTLERHEERVATEASADDAAIFGVQRAVLQDPTSLRELENIVRTERINAEAAVKTLIDRLEARLGGLDGGSVRSYAADLSEPWRRVLDALMRSDREEIQSTDEKVILASTELTPKVVTFLARDRVLGVITEEGGRFSHGAVLARAFGVPCVVGLPNLIARLEQGMLVSVDGGNGRVQLRPDQEDLDAFLERRRGSEARREELAAHAALPAVTPDGHALRVEVNIESVLDFDTFDASHTDGVGLLRTEFLYLERSQFPSEEEQYRLYRRALERMEGRPVTMRTLDIGGDKPLPYFQTPRETNPALGWRGLRITLEWRDLLRVQLRAFLRASVHGELRILLPMVTSWTEIDEVHRIFDEVRSNLLDEGYEVARDVPVGCMIEVPSTLFTLEELVGAVDFVSVGTNDLVQYLLAVDRDNARVSDLYDPQHPSVVRALARVAEAARRAGKSCSVCGDVAGDPATAVVLLGLGYDAVSVAPHFVPEIKLAVRQTLYDRARAQAEDALSQITSTGVRRVLASIRERIYDQSSEGAATGGS